jgi:hypothetical protein
MLAELISEFGRVAPQQPVVNSDPEAEAHLLARVLRLQLLEATRQDHVSMTELGHRLKVSRAAISRALAGEGPMLTSTAAMLAAALGRYWHVELRPAQSTTGRTNAPLGVAITEPSSGKFTATPPNTPSVLQQRPVETVPVA